MYGRKCRLISGIYNLVKNKHEDRCVDSLICPEIYYNEFSLSSRTDAHDTPGTVLNLIASIIMMIMTVFYQRRIETLSKLIDNDAIEVEDYSVLVEGLPSNTKGMDMHMHY
jgi:hypothetical protein